MKRWMWNVSIALFVFMISIGAFGYWNYRNFVNARTLIEQLPSVEKRDKAWADFEGTEQGQNNGGILASTMLNRVWIWSRDGLKTFRVDENSVYSWFDGCSDEVLTLLSDGLQGEVARDVFTNFHQWQQKARTGDYVRIYVVPFEVNEKERTLKEIYSYNFWLFLPIDMGGRCEK